MRLLSSEFKKAAVTAVLSTCLISSFVTPAFAAVDASSLNNKIGNELQAEFNVTELDAVDTVVLSWDEGALNTNKESYDVTKYVQKSISYYVSPGAENDDPLTVSILLKVPQASEDALDTVEDSDDEEFFEFEDADYTYYVLKEGLTIQPGADAELGMFDIAFKRVSEAGIPFTASLIAVEDAIKSPPTLLNGPVYYDKLQVALSEQDDEWKAAISKISYSLDNGVTFFTVVEADIVGEGPKYYNFGGDAFPSAADGENSIIYKFEAEGYEDATITFDILPV